MIKTEQELKDLLLKLAKQPCWDTDDENFCVDDYAGGNVDDAFYGGQDVGEADLAQRLLNEFFGVVVGSVPE